MINFSQLIFDSLPQKLRNLGLSFYHIKKYNQRYGGIYNSYSEFLKKAVYWSDNSFKTYQINRIKKFLIFSYKNTRYYKRIFDRESFSPYNFNKLEELRKIPNLNKKIIRHNYEDIVPRKWIQSQKYITKKTGGTTGSSLHFPKTYRAEQIQYAIEDYVWNIFTGKTFRDIKVAMIAGHKVKSAKNNRPPFWAYNSLSKTLYFSSYHLSNKNFKHYIRKLKSFNPKVVAGYPSSIYLLSKYIVNNHISIKSKYIWLSSETLKDHQKFLIKKAFKGRIHNLYGATEGLGPSFTCREGSNHLTEFDNLIYQKDNSILFTHFENYAFPLINYCFDDKIVYSKKKCRCGRVGKLLKSIQGREEDYIITKDHRKIGLLDHLFKDIDNIIEAQIVQNKIGEADINIVINSRFNGKGKILRNVEERLGSDFKINFNFMDRIPRTRRGKFKFVISNL